MLKTATLKDGTRTIKVKYKDGADLLMKQRMTRWKPEQGDHLMLPGDIEVFVGEDIPSVNEVQLELVRGSQGKGFSTEHTSTSVRLCQSGVCRQWLVSR